MFYNSFSGTQHFQFGNTSLAAQYRPSMEITKTTYQPDVGENNWLPNGAARALTAAFVLWVYLEVVGYYSCPRSLNSTFTFYCTVPNSLGLILDHLFPNNRE